MRALSKVEKDIIRQLIPHGKSLTNLLGVISEELVLKIDKDSKKVVIIIKNHESGRIVSENELEAFYTQRQFFLTTLMRLLTYLDNSGYIHTYTIWDASEKIKYIGNKNLVDEIKSGQCKTITYGFQDNFSITALLQYCESYIVCTEALKVFVSKGFRTPEQIRFKRTFTISIIALSISFSIGLLSLWISIRKNSKPTEIKQDQINSLTYRLDSINQNLRLLQEKENNEIIDSTAANTVYKQ